VSLGNISTDSTEIAAACSSDVPQHQYVMQQYVMTSVRTGEVSREDGWTHEPSM